MKDAMTEAEFNPDIRIEPPLSMLSFLTEVMVQTFMEGYIRSTKIKKGWVKCFPFYSFLVHMTVDEITHLKGKERIFLLSLSLIIIILFTTTIIRGI